MDLRNFAEWVRARPHIRGPVMPLIYLRRAARRPALKRRDRLRSTMLTRIVEGSAVFALPEFGGAFELDIRSDLAAAIMFDGAYEPDAVSLCVHMMDPNSDALDIGANAGLFTGLIASRLNVGRRVASLEPTPHGYELLLRNIARNELGNRVLPLQVVASNREGQHRINICTGREEYSSCGPVVHPSAKGTPVQGQWVHGTTVDALCEEYGLQPAFMKIDVEGYEHNVLQGAEGTIARHKPVILVEVSALMLEACGASSSVLLRWLAQRGYRAVNAASTGTEVSGDFDGEVLAVPQ